jgi:hypothetical protein
LNGSEYRFFPCSGVIDQGISQTHTSIFARAAATANSGKSSQSVSSCQI